jgi:hypothetical protein
MAERPKAPPPPAQPPCRWRSSAETLDVTEALERIEALLLRLESRLTSLEGRAQREEVRR